MQRGPAIANLILIKFTANSHPGKYDPILRVRFKVNRTRHPGLLKIKRLESSSQRAGGNHLKDKDYSFVTTI